VNEAMNAANKSFADILVVDDTPENLTILMDMLRDTGYHVRPVSSGPMALQAATAKPPDLILLDIQMPGMDGYEVCRILKRDPGLASIPVLFLSAFTESEHRIQAFEVGGVDYIPKPFHEEELLARVGLQLRLLRNERELRGNYESLQQLENLRDSLVHMLVHDLRSPLSSVAGSMELVLPEARALLSPDSTMILEEILYVSKRLLQMVTSVLDVNKLEAGRMKLHIAANDLVKIAQEAIAGQQALAGNRGIVLEAPETVMANVDGEILHRVFQNLLNNALKFTPAGGTVRVEIGNDTEWHVARISDSGPGIPRDLHEKIFEKFGEVSETSKSRHGFFSTGLGLPFCRMAIEAHGGTIKVDSEPGKGSSFWFRLPLRAVDEA